MKYLGKDGFEDGLELLLLNGLELLGLWGKGRRGHSKLF